MADTLPVTDSVSTKVTSDKAIICERAVCWNRLEGACGQTALKRVAAHASVGTTEPALEWHLPYGNTLALGNSVGTDTFILIQNPQSKDAEVSIGLYFPGGDSRAPGYKIVVPARSRKTVNVLQDFQGILEVRNFEFSAEVDSSQPVIVEKVIYRKGIMRPVGPIRCRWAAGTPGLTETAKEWFVAEGSTAGGFSTLIAIAHPGTEEKTNVQVYYQTLVGEVKGPKPVLSANDMTCVYVEETVPDEWSVSTRIVADNPVAVERFVSRMDACATIAAGVPVP